MRILFYRYGSICEPDFISGFLELGNEVSEITLEVYNKQTTPLEEITAVKEALLSDTYDFVFSVNFYPAISEICNIFGIRYVCQTVDAPVLELFSDSLKNPWNRTFLFDRAQFAETSPRNPAHIFHLPLASNPARYESVISNASPADCGRFSGDISFVGSLYTEKCPYDRLMAADPYLNGYLEGIMTAQRQVYGAYLLEDLLPDALIESFIHAMPDFYIPPERSMRNDRAVIAQYYLCPRISSMERLHTMSLLGSRFSVNLFTGSNTDGLPVRNRGRVKTLTEMPLVFRHSKINLNITAKAIRTGIPLRVFDVLACEGFLLTNYQPELSDLFEIGEDLDCYVSDDDLLAKIDYYLSHPKERAEIAHNGFLKIKQYHNYPERLLKMISLAYGLS